MKIFNSILMIIFAVLLVSCSKTDELKIVGVSPNDELKVAFAFENGIYSIVQGQTMSEDIGEEIGTINKVVEEIRDNGEAKIYDPSINLKPRAIIYKIKEQDRDAVVAIKIEEKYYTAIFNANLSKK